MPKPVASESSRPVNETRITSSTVCAAKQSAPTEAAVVGGIIATRMLSPIAPPPTTAKDGLGPIDERDTNVVSRPKIAEPLCHERPVRAASM